MKQKKKPTTPKPSPPIKLLNIRTLEPQKNMPSTNEKTYLTLDEHIRTIQNAESQGKRESFKTRFSFNKKSTNQRMEEHNLSPFSNDGRSSSPKYRKTPQKLITPRQQKQVKFTINLKQLEKKKPIKTKATSARQSYGSKKPTLHNINKPVTQISNKQQSQKKKPSSSLSSTNPKRKKPLPCDKQQKARIQFQNQFLSMMNNRIHKQKITQMSDQQLQGSIKKKKPNLQICIIQSDNSDSINTHEKKLTTNNNEKKQIVKTMKLKVMKKILRDYPNLDVGEKKVMCAVIILQRLWRQRKVKQFFQHYVTPKASPECSFRESLNKEVDSNNSSTMNLLTSHIVKKQQAGGYSNSCDAVKPPNRKKISASQNVQENFLIRQNSQQSYHQTSLQNHNTSQSSSLKQQSKLNDKVTKMLQDSIIPFQNDNQKIVKESSSIDQPSMIKFIECYRQIKLSSSKKQTKSKRNIFSLKQSLSQKCLMQKYYTRIFSDRPQKDKPKNYELFSQNNSSLNNQSLKQNQQSSIEIFKQISKHPDYISPQKLLKKEQDYDEEVWVRNQTSYSHEETDSDQLVAGKNTGANEIRKIVVDQIVYAESFYKKDTGVEGDKQQIVLSPKKQPRAEQLSSIQPSCGIIVNQRSQQPPTQNKTPSKQNPQFSLKCIQKVSQDLINQLLSQFFKQYVGFQQKQCLVKKHRSSPSKQQQEKQKKPRLPGIEITQKSITQYLDILIPYILTNDRQQVLKSLELFHPSTYQKCHRVQSSVYELFEFAQEQDDDIYWNIITNEGFFMCLESYWKKNVTLTKQNEKFTNFLDLTYKVYNRCITDTFSQLFNKQVLQKIVYPWNKLNQSLYNRNKIHFSQQVKSLLNSEVIETIAEEVKQKLLKQSFCYSTTGGKLLKKDRKEKPIQKKEFEFGEVNEQELMIEKLSDDEFSKVMKIADDQFLQDQKEIKDCLDQRYELKADISEAILDELMKEISSELLALQQSSFYQQPSLSKSQNEIFLETNQTLETNYHF